MFDVTSKREKFCDNSPTREKRATCFPSRDERTRGVWRHNPPRTHARPSDTLERLTLLSTMPRASRSKAADQDTDMVADEVVRPRGRSRRRSFPRN